MYDAYRRPAALLVAVLSVASCEDGTGPTEEDGAELRISVPPAVAAGQAVTLAVEPVAGEAAPGWKGEVAWTASLVIPHAFGSEPYVVPLRPMEPATSPIDGGGRATTRFEPPLGGRFVVRAEGPGGWRDSVEIEVAPGSPQPGEAWQRVELPNSRYALRPVVVEGRVHLVGGACETASSGCTLPCEALPECHGAVLFVYDPGAGTWSSLRQPPGFELGAATLAAVSSDGVHAVVEGLHHRLDPTSGEWLPLASPPAWAREGASLLESVGETLYLMAGTGALAAYDPAADAWSARAAREGSGTGSAATVLDGALYVAGGADDPSAMPTDGAFHRYDAGADRWVRLASMPLARSEFALFALEGRICAAGGGLWLYRDFRTFELAHCYDPATDRWSIDRSIPSAGGRWSSAAEGPDGVYLFTGAEPDNAAAPFWYGGCCLWRRSVR